MHPGSPTGAFNPTGKSTMGRRRERGRGDRRCAMSGLDERHRRLGGKAVERPLLRSRTFAARRYR